MNSLQKIHYSNDRNAARLYSGEIEPAYFKGAVLYLGLGSAYLPRHQGTGVTSTTIVEKDPELVEYFSNLIAPDWEVIIESAEAWKTRRKFNHIVIDFFENITPKKDLEEIKAKYKPRLKSGGSFEYVKKLFK